MTGINPSITDRMLDWPVFTHDTCDNAMNDDALNTSIRKFLKKVGVTSQQEIEKALRQAEADGTLEGDTLPIKVVLTVDGVNLRHEVDGELKLEEDD